MVYEQKKDKTSLIKRKRIRCDTIQKYQCSILDLVLKTLTILVVQLNSGRSRDL